jgi:hypothetical protein
MLSVIEIQVFLKSGNIKNVFCVQYSKKIAVGDRLHEV